MEERTNAEERINGSDKEDERINVVEERTDAGNNKEAERIDRRKNLPLLASYGQLKRTTSASTPLSSSLLSINDELNQSHRQV